MTRKAARQTRRGEDRFAFLDEMEELPTLPQVLVGVSRVASDPTSSAADLAEVILKDQALTMKVLRVANSARYGVTAQRITTVSRAVVLLGFQSVRAIAVGLGAYQLLSALRRGGGVLRSFWLHAVATAVVCQELAELLRYEVPEEAFVAGLLHDVGKLVLAEHDPKAAARVYDAPARGPELLREETRAFGVNHVEVGAELARRWELPDVLVRAIEHHHRHFSSPPPDRGDRLAFLASVGKALAEPLWTSTEPPRNLASAMARVVRKPVGLLLAMLQDVPSRIGTYAEFFDLKVEDLETYTLWVEQENQRLQQAFADQEAARRRAERQEAELAAVREIHGLLLRGVEPESVVRRVLRACRDVAGASRAVACRLKERPPRLQVVAAEGDVTPPFLEGLARLDPGGGLMAMCLEQAQPVAVFDRELPYFTRLMTPEEGAVFDSPCFVLLPLGPEGDPLGILYADRDPGDEPFSDDEVESLATLADLGALALARKA